MAVEGQPSGAQARSTLSGGPQMIEPLAGLERQVERDSMRTQSLFNRTFDRMSELERLLLGLLDVLLKRGVVSEEELGPAARAIGEQLDARGEGSEHAVVLRQDGEAEAARPEVFVDCAARMHVCQAVCCKLAVQLSADEVERGGLRWDLGRPYLLRRESDGRCTHQDRSSGFCGVYEDRPLPCRQYSCANDRRIWRDFEGMVLNKEWIEANLGGDRPRFIPLQPLRRPGLAADEEQERAGG
jgi:Fe-S-cluster containining protein